MAIRLLKLAQHVKRRLDGVHRDEQGTISIITVFVMLMFTMLLMMLVNVAKQLDDKVRMQDGVDAATYSGSVVLARGMNAIAFTNHLEADVFAMTAFLREARDRNAEQYVPEILAAWQESGALFAAATFPKFIPLPQEISGRIPLEQQFVTAWGEMAAAAAENALPVYEHILGTPETMGSQAEDHLIPNFQSAVVKLTPTLAQDVTYELALRHGIRQADLQSFSRGGRQMRFQPDAYPAPREDPRGRQAGVLWRTSVEPVGLAGESDPLTRTLPVVSPEFDNADPRYMEEARKKREFYARTYLDDWITDRNPRDRADPRFLDFADEEARMTQYARLFHAAACLQLDKLLNEEYPNTNVPFILRDFDRDITNQGLNDNFTYVGVAYRRHVRPSAPKFFRNPLARTSDAETYAASRLYIPRRRYVKVDGEWVYWTRDRFGNWIPHAYRENRSHEWSTFNQNWTIRLVPANVESMPEILSSNPGGPIGGLQPPNVRSMSNDDFHALNTH